MSVEKDEELYLRYGSHANRTLFVEYGFINMWSEGECRTGTFCGEVDVQDMVEDLFARRGAIGKRMREVLEAEGYWGYTYLFPVHIAQPTNIFRCCFSGILVIGRYTRNQRLRILRIDFLPRFECFTHYLRWTKRQTRHSIGRACSGEGSLWEMQRRRTGKHGGRLC